MESIKYSLLILTMICLIFACGKNDEDAIVAAFEVSTEDIFENETISFTNTSINASIYSWDFGDGNTSTTKSPSHTYSEAGSFSVKLTASNEAGDSKEISQSIIVKVAPLVLTSLFDISEGPYVNKKDIDLTNKSIKATSYLWDFGDGNTSTKASPTIQYASDGTYVIKLTAFDAEGQSSSSEKPIEIVKNPDLLSADFIVENSELYYRKELIFSSTSSEAKTFKWDFGDGNVSDENKKRVTHSYFDPGSYNVKLTVSDGTNEKTMTKTFEVAVKFVRRTITLRGITSTTHDHKVFGDIDIRIENILTQEVWVERQTLWNDQGTRANTGILGNKTSFDNISKSISVNFDEVALLSEGYRILSYANVGVWHKDNVFASWGRITGNGSKLTFIDGNDSFDTGEIATTSDPNRVHKLKVYFSVK